MPLGIKARVAMLDALQIVDAGATVTGGDATDFHMDTAALRGTNAKSLVDLLEYSCDRITDGEPDLILASDLTVTWINSMLKQTGYYKTTTDMFDREVTSWRGAPILGVGKGSDRKTSVISDTTEGTQTGTTALYILKLGEDAVHLVEFLPYTVQPPKLLEDNVTVMASIEWAWGIANPDPTGIVKVDNLHVA
jgi:hypothetical protein